MPSEAQSKSLLSGFGISFLLLLFGIVIATRSTTSRIPTNSSITIQTGVIEDDQSPPYGLRCWCGAEIVAVAGGRDGVRTRCARGHEFGPED
jgi:hypothetical protein